MCAGLRAKSYSLRTPTGFQFRRRAIAFLVCDDDGSLEAWRIFEGLTEKVRRDVRVRIDHWLQGNVHDKYFHGFPNQAQYKTCFAFKWHVKRQEHRFYGFLYNPKPTERFQLCVLVHYTPKNEMGTDYTILDRINRLRMQPAVLAAIAIDYPEQPRGISQWQS